MINFVICYGDNGNGRIGGNGGAMETLYHYENCCARLVYIPYGLWLLRTIGATFEGWSYPSPHSLATVQASHWPYVPRIFSCNVVFSMSYVAQS